MADLLRNLDWQIPQHAYPAASLGPVVAVINCAHPLEKLIVRYEAVL